jgi:tRNA(Ile)-lysidine synthase
MAINTIQFKKKWDFLHDKKIYIACSGGLDSVVLTHLVQTISKNCVLLHVNYHLREEESNRDEKFVRDLAKKLNISVEVKSVDIEEYSKKEAKNIQNFARDFRYTWFKTFLEDKNSVLLLGHHLDDQIETFYLNLARKSGIFGMACMLEKNENIFRPLLNYEKKEIQKFAEKNKYNWIEDSSNFKNKYNRNKLRNEFLPNLHQEIPQLKKSIQFLIKIFQKEVREVEKSVEKNLKKITKTGIIEFDFYRKLSSEQRFLIFKYFNFNASQHTEINKLLDSEKGKFILSSSHKLLHEGTFFSIFSRNEIIKIPKLLISSCIDLPEKFTKNELYLDKNKLEGELKIRVWKSGDRIQSLGLKGTQLISDIIKDSKIPSAEKNKVFVIHDEKRILWCYGLKVSSFALASVFSEEIWKISLGE